MTKIEIIPYQKEHLDQLEVQPSQQGEIPKVIMSRAVTFMIQEKPVAIFGAFNFCQGVVQIWALISNEAKKYPIAFHKACKELLEFLTVTEKPRRFQIDVRADFRQAHQWAQALGFQEEGLMRNYAKDGMDCYLFAKVIR